MFLDDELFHLNTLEITSGHGDITSGAADHRLRHLGLSEVAVVDGHLGGVRGGDCGPAAAREVAGGECSAGARETVGRVRLDVVEHAEADGDGGRRVGVGEGECYFGNFKKTEGVQGVDQLQQHTEAHVQATKDEDRQDKNKS